MKAELREDRYFESRGDHLTSETVDRSAENSLKDILSRKPTAAYRRTGSQSQK
jgi:hypothetical protein